VVTGSEEIMTTNKTGDGSGSAKLDQALAADRFTAT
jgi:hypothetical protein